MQKLPKPSENRPMATKTAALQFSTHDALLHAYATGSRINIYLINAVPDAAWRAKLPGGKGREIGSIAGHLHNVRLLWLKSAGKTPSLPAKLETETCTQAEVVVALTESAAALATVLSDALATDGRIKGFKPDAASFFAYLIAHDAHHRGQITMLARQLGHPVSQSAMFGLWEWGTR